MIRPPTPLAPPEPEPAQRALVHRAKRAEMLERQARQRIEARNEAKAVAGPEGEIVVADGGEDNSHARRVNEQLRMADDDGEDPTDGLERPELHIGDHVSDMVDPDQDATMIVVGKPTIQASAYELDDGPLTVADCNPPEMADDRVIEVAFVDRGSMDLDGTKRYAYPRSRLALEHAIHQEGDDE